MNTEKTPRIYLSPPHMGGTELEFIFQAFASNYIAPTGPMISDFEKAFADYTGIPYCVALSSGTAAIHLALKHLLQDGSREVACRTETRPVVLASTLTFIGSIAPATYERCDIAFIDCDKTSWNMDPALLEEELAEAEKQGRLPVAVIPTDLYGQCCNLPLIRRICNRYGVPVICDSAEAMGAKYRDTGSETSDPQCRGETENRNPDTEPRRIHRHAGFDAHASVFSFNGNKIITSSGGGMLASQDQDLIDHARKLAAQACDPAPHYEHSEIGYNYRMSNIVAAIGYGQLQVLDERIRRKREIFAAYLSLLDDLPGITFMPEADYNRATRWLTVLLIDEDTFGATPAQVRLALEHENVESRPVWKPMHLQPVFLGSRVRGGAEAEDLFTRGLCLPSGTAMSDGDIDRVAELVRKASRVHFTTQKRF